MTAELPKIFEFAWRGGQRLSSGCMSPELHVIIGGVACAVAANSCVYVQEVLKDDPTPAQPQKPSNSIEFPKKLHVPDVFKCEHAPCPPSPYEFDDNDNPFEKNKPSWLKANEEKYLREAYEWASKIRTAEKAAGVTRDRYWLKLWSYKKEGRPIPKELEYLDELIRNEEGWKSRIGTEREALIAAHPDEYKRYQEYLTRLGRLHKIHNACMAELEPCLTKEQKSRELAASIRQINSVEPLSLNMDIVPVGARPFVERYLEFDRKFCEGFPATSGELIKLKPKWQSVTQDFARLQRMMQILDSRFRQYGSFEAFYAMQDMVEFDGQFRAAIPLEIFAVINADFQKKTKLWWRYVREHVRGLGITYDLFQSSEKDATRGQPPPRTFLP